MGACGSKKSDAVAEQPTSNPQEQEGGPAAATPAVVKATDEQADSAVDGGDVQVQDGEQVTQQEGSELTYALPVAHKENKQGIALSEACTGTDVEVFASCSMRALRSTTGIENTCHRSHRCWPRSST